MGDARALDEGCLIRILIDVVDVVIDVREDRDFIIEAAILHVEVELESLLEDGVHVGDVD